MANLRVAIAIGRVGKFERYEHAVSGAKPARPFLQHLICKLLPYQCGEKLVENDPLKMPAQIPRRCFEYAIGRGTTEPRYIHKHVVSLEHGKMQLRDQHVRIVARIANNRDAVGVALEVESAGAKQELRSIVALVEERMAGGPVAVQTFEVDLRAARVAQFRRRS